MVKLGRSERWNHVHGLGDRVVDVPRGPQILYYRGNGPTDGMLCVAQVKRCAYRQDCGNDVSELVSVGQEDMKKINDYLSSNEDGTWKIRWL